MTTWFRSWHGAPTDNKWLVIARRAGTAPGVVSAIFWALLDHASQANDRGSVVGFDAETYAEFSGFDYTTVLAVLQAMAEKGVIVAGRLAAWEKRQPKREDDSAARVQRYREARNSAGDGNAEQRTVTHGNAPEPDTDPDTDPETETEEKTTTPANAVGVGVGVFSSSDSDTARGVVFEHWQENIPGKLTKLVTDEIDQMIAAYGPDEVIRAVTEACMNNVRKPNYVRGILKRRASGQDKPAAPDSEDARRRKFVRAPQDEDTEAARRRKYITAEFADIAVGLGD